MSSDAIAITTEDVDTDTSLELTPEQAFNAVQEAMGESQEAYDALPLPTKRLAEQYAESTLA